MAQVGYTPISLYYSATASAAPSAGNLANGELALNITDGRLFYKDNGGVVQVLATKAGASGDVVGPGSSTDNALVRFDGTTGKLVQNSAGILDDSGNLTGLAAVTMSGALTLSGGTANGVAYLNGSKVLTSGSALTFDGTNLGIGTSPTAELTINGFAGGADVRLQNTASGVGAGNGMDVGLGSAGDNGYMWLYESGYLYWGIGGSEQMRLTSTGLGIGTSSPGQKLVVQTTASGDVMQLLTSAGGGQGWKFGIDTTNSLMYCRSNTSLYSYAWQDVSNNNLMLLTNSGNLGLGVTPNTWYSGTKAVEIGATTALMDISGQTNLYQNAYLNAAGSLIYKTNNYATQYRAISGQHQWFTAPSGTAGNAISFTQVMTLDANGVFMVGTTGASWNTIRTNNTDAYALAVVNGTTVNPYGLQVSYANKTPNTVNELFVSCVDSTAARMQVRANGGIANYSANNVNLSDRREKTNFAPAGEYLSKICAIPVQTFNYIDQNTEEDPGLTLGVVAQDVQAVAPELVMESNWGTEEEPKMRLSVYQTDLQYALMKCIQEQQAIIEQLKADVAALKGA